MRYVWLAIIVVSAGPVLLLGWLANPFFVVLFGMDAWRERVVRPQPYRWWLLLSLAVCAFSAAVFTATYA